MPTRPTLDEERRLWASGHRWVAGLDEVGRGAWAGPVSVGVAVVCPGIRTSSLPAWLRDSKQLAEDRRESVFGEVADWCADGAVGHATAAECDRWGMAAALRLAAYRALAALELPPDAVLVDGPHDLLRPTRPRPVQPRTARPRPTRPRPVQPRTARPEVEQPELALGEAPALARDPLPPPAALVPPDGGVLPLPEVVLPATVVPVVGGDARCAAVAAASVLAKVVRDRMMREEAVHFPAYCFERNKGYPSPAHQIALRGYGLSAIHRRSWAFVSDLPWR